MDRRELCNEMAAEASRMALLGPIAWRVKVATIMKSMLKRVERIAPMIDAVNGGRIYPSTWDFNWTEPVFTDLDPKFSDEDHLNALRPVFTRLCSKIATDEPLASTLDGSVLHTPSWMFRVFISRFNDGSVRPILARASCCVEVLWTGRHDACSIEELLGVLNELKPVHTTAEAIQFIWTLAEARRDAIISRQETTHLAYFTLQSGQARLLLLSFTTGIRQPTLVAQLNNNVVVVMDGENRSPESGVVWMVEWSVRFNGAYTQTTVLPASVSAEGLQAFFNVMGDVLRDASKRPNTANLVRYLIQNEIHQTSIQHKWPLETTNYLRQNHERFAQFTVAVAQLVYPDRSASRWNQSSAGIVHCGHGDQWWQVVVTLGNDSVTVRPSARPGSAFLDVGDAEDAASETRVARRNRRVFDRRVLEAAMRRLMDAVDLE